MIKIKLLDIINKKDRNLNWLANSAGITYSTLYNFAHQNTNSVTYDILEKLCVTLKCNVSDIIEYIPSNINIMPESELEMLENAVKVIRHKKNNNEDISPSELDFLYNLLVEALKSLDSIGSTDEQDRERFYAAYVECVKLLPQDLSVKLTSAFVQATYFHD